MAKVTLYLTDQELSFLHALIARLILATNTRYSLSALIKLFIRAIKEIAEKQDFNSLSDDVRNLILVIHTMSQPSQ